MLANRLRKNFRKLLPRFERRSVGAFRVYDWDIPEVRAAIDWYEGHAVVAWSSDRLIWKTRGVPR